MLVLGAYRLTCPVSKANFKFGELMPSNKS